MPHVDVSRSTLFSQLIAVCVLLFMLPLAQAEESNDDWDDEEVIEIYDPWEPMNRAIYSFNVMVDDYAIKPMAKGYRSVVPDLVKTGVSNAYDNFAYPVTIVNDFLQGKFVQGCADIGRFIVNTTVGIIGVFDVAQHINLPEHREDFGQTFGKWGVGEGPYLVLPLLGPRNVRDAVGLVGDILVDPLYQVKGPGAQNALVAVDVVDYRYRLLDATDLVDEALDPYAFVRESFTQQRRSLITKHK